MMHGITNTKIRKLLSASEKTVWSGKAHLLYKKTGFTLNPTECSESVLGKNYLNKRQRGNSRIA
jgi:hypothetical protein